MAESELRQIVEKLESIESELKYIKKHLFDSDLMLSDEDEKDIKEAIDAHKKGKTRRL
jgi:hypothetical protein